MASPVSGCRRTTMASCIRAMFQDGSTVGSGLTVWNSRATASAARNAVYRPHIGGSRTLSAGLLLSSLSQPNSLRHGRPDFCVVWRHDRICIRQSELAAIVVGRHLMFDYKVALARLEMLAALKTDEMIGAG